MGYLKYDISGLNINVKNLEEKTVKLRENLEINTKNMPFLYSFSTRIKDIKEILRRFKIDFDNMFVIGIGGSSLGIQAIYEAIHGKYKIGGRKLYFLENIDPFNIHQIFQNAPWDRTVYCVISKSGKTLETVSIMNLVLHEMKRRGFRDLHRRFIFISGENTPLHRLSKELEAPFFHIPENIGGRFSVLTPVGLVPSEFVDIDPYALLGGAMETVEEIIREPLHPSIVSVLAQYLNYKEGRDVAVLMPYSDSLRKFSDWWVQLWAESLGKEGKGQTPLPAVGTVDQHSLLQLFIDGPDDKFYQFIKLRSYGSNFVLPEKTEILDFIGGKTISEIVHAEFEGTVESLKMKKRPVCTIEIDRITPEAIGALFIVFMIKTTIMAHLIGVNPYGQPGVEIGKKIAKEKLGGSQ
ncbi:glucose-6-phosphate isomerase [Desulfurobacterium sp. TC5-1]|uniref:glucose-6-phosphate isomerase n=1 Tax=Desulfurobacterium sp. TC5-1 TaxID=1158318 RepID=UPI0003B4F1D7|nr:glucose-6-phosphate isomerase [Desulfurobacterium sp. TC5-1]